MGLVHMVFCLSRLNEDIMQQYVDIDAAHDASE